MSAAALLRLKKLTGAGKVLVAAQHNRRAIAAELGAASHIDASRCRLNVVMAGPDAPQGVAELAQSLMDAAGVGKLRKDAVRAVEAVFSLPANGGGVDAAAYFARCVEWASATFGPVLSADAHHDEATPHVHVLCLPLVNGRMVGSDLVGGPSRLRTLQTDFHGKVAQAFGLQRGTARLSGRTRQDTAAAILAHLKATSDPALKSVAWPVIRDAIERDPVPFAQTLGFDVSSASRAPKPAKTFTAIMTGQGRGAKTHAEQERRDRRLNRSKPIGFAIADDGDSGSSHELDRSPEKTRTLACVGFASAKAAS
ncbi:MAG: plasmid recombination protein [Leptothrix sp. (in: b-proteobacteria)]